MSNGNESEVFLGLIERHSFNSMNGKQVAADLRAERRLWDAVIFYRTDVGITIRDMPDGSYNADTVSILTDTDRWELLYPFLKQWSADSITVLLPEQALVGERYSVDEVEPYILKTTHPGARQLSDELCSHHENENRVLIHVWWD